MNLVKILTDFLYTEKKDPGEICLLLFCISLLVADHCQGSIFYLQYMSNIIIIFRQNV